VYALPQIYLYGNIIVKFNNINPVKLIIFIDDLLNLTKDLEIETKIWVYSFCDFNFDDLHKVHSLIRDYIEYLQNPRLTCIEYYGECSQRDYYQLKLRVQDDWDNLLTNIKDNTKSEDQTTVTELLIDYDCEINPDLTYFISREWNKSWLNHIAYTNPNLCKSYEIYNKIRQTELNYKKSDQYRQLLFLETHDNSNNNHPLISIVTSVYKGKEFMQGFLKNITAQTIFSQCELILIDGNSPENEGEIIEAFIRKNGFSNIHYHRLDEDPGLYECWNIAIRQSRGKYITNAN
ncbi:MAG: glycosyltransferase family 2 protein, partial [Planktothrix sp.]